MIQLADRSLLRWAILGDAIVLIIITILGFATHGTLDETWRMLITTLGTLLAWAIVAPWFGAFSTASLTRPSSIWRVAYAWAVAAPVAGFLRGWFLGIGVSSTFILTAIAINGLSLVIWRLAYAAINRTATTSRTQGS
jgi:hypothetical protein